MSTYFKAKRSCEDLVLSETHILSGTVAQYLTNFQLDGVRFIHKCYVENKACILNDDTGLGKTVVTIAFLKAILPKNPGHKWLIIVKDEDRLQNWRYHLNKFGKLSEKVIEKEIEIDSEQQIYLVKFTNLVNKCDTFLTNFNFLILDDRDDLMSSSACMGYFQKYSKGKMFLYIAKLDVTLDLKKLYGILKMCNRLDDKFWTYQVFSRKFSLPLDSKETKIDGNEALLEAYFQRREKLINYCRGFRLRRYFHQFENELPFIDSESFEKYVKEWKEGNNNVSLSTSGSVQVVSTSSEKDAERLLNSFFKSDSHDLVLRVSPERETINCNRQNSETIEMPSLLLESESEEMINEPQNCLESADIVVEATQKQRNKRARKKRSKQASGPSLARETRSANRVTRSKAKKNKYLLYENSIDERVTRIRRHRNKHKIIPEQTAKDEESNILLDNTEILRESQSIDSISIPKNGELKATVGSHINKDCSKSINLLPAYDFGLDIIDPPLFASNNSSEIQFYQPDDEIIMLSSSLEDNEDNLETGCKLKKQNDSRRINDNNETTANVADGALSPEIFETPDSNEIPFSGKTLLNMKHSNDPLKCSNNLEKNETTNGVCSISTSGSPKYSNKSGKITQYLLSGNIDGSYPNESNRQIQIRTELQESNKFLKTPKNRKLLQKSSSTGKRTAKTQNKSVTTPNSLTKWLMKSTLSETSLTKPKRKLNFWLGE